MTETDSSMIAARFSLVIGGPFYKALVRMRLVEHPGPNIPGRILIAMLLTWAPLFALSLAQGTAFGNWVKLPLLYDFSIYARFFAALPLLLAAEVVIDPWIRRVVSTFESSGIVEEDDLPAYHAELRAIMRLRDSRLAELLLALLATFPFFLLADYQWVSPEASAWHGSTSEGLTAAGWWFAFVSSPVLRFLLFRWLWRYFLWSVLLRKVAKLNLEMLPTHPDRLGGLGFVLGAQRHFGILASVLGSIFAGQYANSIAHYGTSFAAARGPVLSFVAVSILFVIGPLILFTPKLMETRRIGLAKYGQLARRLGKEFAAKWVSSAHPQESMLGSPDPSTLIDYVSSYDVIRQMQTIPINRQLVIQVTIQAAAPLALVWLIMSPSEKIVEILLKILT